MNFIFIFFIFLIKLQILKFLFDVVVILSLLIFLECLIAHIFLWINYRILWLIFLNLICTDSINLIAFINFRKILIFDFHYLISINIFNLNVFLSLINFKNSRVFGRFLIKIFLVPITTFGYLSWIRSVFNEVIYILSLINIMMLCWIDALK